MSSRHSWRIVRLISSAALLAAVGCGGPGGPPSVSSSNTPATVSGTIKVNGTPVSGGKVTFDPTNIRRKDANSTTVEIGKDGTYKVTTLVGENRVVVDTPEIRKDSASLSNGETSFNANSGENTFDISFPLKP